MAIAPSRVGRHDITIHQGMDEYYPVRFMEPDGTVIDLGDYTATFSLYRAPATLASLHEHDPVLTGDTTNGRVQLGLFDGGEFGFYNCYIGLTSHVTSGLGPWGVGVYNLDIIDPFGHVQYRVRGAISLEEGTRHG